MRFSEFTPIEIRRIDDRRKRVVTNGEFLSLSYGGVEVHLRFSNSMEAKALSGVAKMGPPAEHPAKTLDQRLFLARLAGADPWENILAMQSVICYNLYLEGCDEMSDEMSE